MSPIADMITIIKNGYLARKSIVVVPYSRVKEAVAKKILEAGFIESVDIQKDKRDLKIALLYKDSKPVMHEVKIISRPSLRIYAPSRKIPRILRGRGETVLSTSKGVMTGSEARKAKVGGELILKIW